MNTSFSRVCLIALISYTNNNQMYVPGKLCNPGTFVCDVGTGYYLEKVCSFILQKLYDVRFAILCYCPFATSDENVFLF